MIIRVFPRRTSYTPTDEMAFVGDPPLFRPEADEAHVSLTFTWDRVEAVRLRDAWAQYYPVVKIGGPAWLADLSEFTDGFEPGMYVREGVTFTSRGCNSRCPWCLVSEREGKLRLLDVKPGWIVQDNNLLACPREHQAKVYEMLREQKKAAKFAGGLDVRLVDDWVAGQLRALRIKEVFLAADTDAALPYLEEAVKRLSWLRRDQLRCYVLCAFGDETLDDAERRLEAVWRIGCVPFAQLYQPPEEFVRYDRTWRTLARKWSRPAAIAASHAVQKT